ncbi:MAG: hypothetical protein Q8R54_02385, partial [Methylobacter sp.]|nr:hypothetical protein [Methylobacter sp.]
CHSLGTTAWTDICSSATAPALLYYRPAMALCNICIHHIHVAYAGGRTMQEQLSIMPNNHSITPFSQIITKLSLYRQAYQKNMINIQAPPNQNIG